MSTGEGGSEDKLQAARVEERLRLARAVHDRLGGDLTAVKMALAVLARRLPQEPGLREQLDYVDKLVDGAIDSMHGIAEAWSSPPAASVAEIVEQQVEAFRKQSGLDCQCAAERVPLDPDGAAGEALNRILRECLVNIGKHANAQHVQVTLCVADGHAILTVRDDGIGVGTAPPNARSGLGLRFMRERAAEAGGRFSIRPEAHRGTLVTVELPLGSQPSADATAGSP